MATTHLRQLLCVACSAVPSLTDVNRVGVVPKDDLCSIAYVHRAERTFRKYGKPIK